MRYFCIIELLLIFISGFADSDKINGTQGGHVSFRLVVRCPNLTNQTIDVTKLAALSIIPNKPIKILLHAYEENADTPYIVNLASGYLKKDNLNIILADYSSYLHLSYDYAANNTFAVGQKVGNLIVGLNISSNVSLNRVHLIGFSLGAHVAGIAGKYVKNITGNLVRRISALDPAGLTFTTYPSYRRLENSDAAFIDVIYTDRGKLGINYLAGHANFYPNDGTRSQPYCRSLISFYTENKSRCSHKMAAKYFLESINSLQFIASKCDQHKFLDYFTLSNYTAYKWGYCKHYPSALMGENCDPKARGVYYLRTNSYSPFARGNIF